MINNFHNSIGKPNRTIKNMNSLIGKGDKAHINDESGYFVWGSCVIKHSDGLYYSFIERWIDTDGYDGFVHYIKILVSDGCESFLGPFTGYSVIDELFGQAWCAQISNGPKVIYHENKYWLFFVGSHYTTISYPILTSESRNNARIGVATANHPQGPYTLHPDNPILEPRVDNWDQVRVTNHSIWKDINGVWRMTYKADYNGNVGDRRLGMVQSTDLVNWTGKEDFPNFAPSLPDGFNGEDQEVWREGDKWYAMVVDIAGTIVGVRQGVFLISNNGIDFYVSENQPCWDRSIEWTDETTNTYIQEERPFILTENGYAIAVSTVLRIDATNSFNLVRPIKFEP